MRLLRSAPAPIRFISVLCWLMLAAATGCQPDVGPYELEVMEHRFAKNVELASVDSPVIRPEDKPRFKGLNYFEVDSAYRFVLPLMRDTEPEFIMMAQTLSGPEPKLRIGTVEVPFPEGTGTLSVFQAAPDLPTRIWIPFADATSGRETYGGGRYVEGELRQDIVVVDFNYAYNPFCEYNPDYNCAVPPESNRLRIAVRAGERRSLLLANH